MLLEKHLSIIFSYFLCKEISVPSGCGGTDLKGLLLAGQPGTDFVALPPVYRGIVGHANGAVCCGDNEFTLLLLFPELFRGYSHFVFEISSEKRLVIEI